MKEIWKDVVGFEGAYQISNRGRIKSFKRLKTGKILSNVNKTGWYLNVVLKYKKRQRYVKIHQLVAEAFLGKRPFDNAEINHKDANKQNNCVENLEYVTRLENVIHAAKIHNYAFCKSMNYYNQRIRPRPVLQYSLDGKFIAEYYNCADAGKITGVCARNIHQVASKTEYNNGSVRSQAGGFKWVYKDERVVA